MKIMAALPVVVRGLAVLEIRGFLTAT